MSLTWDQAACFIFDNAQAKAGEALARAVEHYPRNVELLTQYARALREQGRRAKAVELSRLRLRNHASVHKLPGRSRVVDVGVRLGLSFHNNV